MSVDLMQPSSKIQKLSKIDSQTRTSVPLSVKRPHDYKLYLRSDTSSANTNTIEQTLKNYNHLAGLSGTIEYSLSNILTQIGPKLKKSELFHFKSIWGHDPVAFYFPPNLDWGNYLLRAHF